MTELTDSFATLSAQIADLDQRVNALSGPHVNITEGAINPDGDVVEGPHAEIVAETIVLDGPLPGESLSDWPAMIGEQAGYVVDPGVARIGPCLRISLGGSGRSLVYKKGVVGTLNPEQVDLYCQEGFIEREATPRQLERIEAMGMAAEACSTQVAEAQGVDRLSVYFSCLGKELRGRGIDL